MPHFNVEMAPLMYLIITQDVAEQGILVQQL